MKTKKIIQEFQELLDSNITNTMIKFSKLNRGYLSKLEISAGIIAQQWIKDNKKMSEDFFLKALEKQKSDLAKEIDEYFDNRIKINVLGKSRSGLIVEEALENKIDIIKIINEF